MNLLISKMSDIFTQKGVPKSVPTMWIGIVNTGIGHNLSFTWSISRSF